MNDTINLNNATAVTVAASPIAFARVASTGKTGEVLRRNLADGSLNPQVLRIAHQPLGPKRDKQRSLCALDKTFSRVDGLGNVLSTDELTVALQFSRTANVTEAEFLVQLQRLVGLLAESTYAIAKQLYNTEE